MPGYGEDLAAIHAAGFTGPARAAAAELLRRLERPSLVVELGCGDGTAARLLTDAGHEVVGIDSSPALIDRARRQAPRAVLRVGSFVDAELPGGVDAVLAVGEVLGYRLMRATTPGRSISCWRGWPRRCAGAGCCCSISPGQAGCPGRGRASGGRGMAGR
jgi:SAM-dependent methyltransferase